MEGHHRIWKSCKPRWCHACKLSHSSYSMCIAHPLCHKAEHSMKKGAQISIISTSGRCTWYRLPGQQSVCKHNTRCDKFTSSCMQSALHHTFIVATDKMRAILSMERYWALCLQHLCCSRRESHLREQYWLSGNSQSCDAIQHSHDTKTVCMLQAC